MEIIRAKTAGFCFGVTRAVNRVYELAKEKGKKVYTYGPIIHNEVVVHDLESMGVTTLETREELEALQEGCVVIRSHGVTREIHDLITGKDLELVDATCPFVKKIHRIVDTKSNEGYDIIIVGSENHPEVQGIRGWCNTESFVIESEESADTFLYTGEKPLYLIAQTTFNLNKFSKIVEILKKKNYNLNYINTICSATSERQMEAASIAKKVDAMIVIGGNHSSNTQKLFEICKKECKNTVFVQTLSDLDDTTLPSIRCVGITAGASTPNNIIEEVLTRMSELSFEQMLDENCKSIHNGEVVEGTVIDVKDDEIILNIGYKSDGIITKSEYSNDSSVNLKEAVQVGDKMEVKVIRVNDGEGQVSLSHKQVIRERGSQKLEEAYKNGEVLTAPVVQVMNGGLRVTVDETSVFIPASLVSDVYENNLAKYQGQEIEFVIIEFEPAKRRVIGDRKQLLKKQKEADKKALFERIAAGDIVDGVVKNVTDFGAFVDLGGADGLLHISEMSWGRVDNPKKLFKNGQELKVLVKSIDGEKIALSLKFDDQNPWKLAAEKYAVGNVVEGKVARMTDFGAFIELEPGVDALLHVSQISRNHVEKPSDVLSKGQTVTVKVVEFKEADKKISLSMKAIEAAPETEE